MKKCKKGMSLFLAVVLAVMMLAGCSGQNVTTENTGSSDYRVCMITDAGDITDQSFNQTTYEACRDYCKAHNIDFTYKKPDGDTDYARTAMVDVAVAEGYNILVMPGYVFAQTVVDTTFKYPDIKFIVLDMSAGDIGAAAVGNAYYDNPDAYDVSQYYNTGNTYLAIYQEAIPGYLAGYTAVKLGYRHLGFLGGQAVPGVMRYGYGYVQGIDAAAKVGGKVIGVDSDQSPIIDVYGEGTTITSAMKSLTATVNSMLDSIIYDGIWDEHVGKVENLGLVSKDDMSLNYVGLPEDTTQWNDDFGLEDYKNLVADIFDGKVEVSNSIDEMPAVSVKLNVRQGTIK